jgi:hypothetical protein
VRIRFIDALFTLFGISYLEDAEPQDRHLAPVVEPEVLDILLSLRNRKQSPTVTMLRQRRRLL